MELTDFLAKLENVKALPSGFSARCPAHDDRVASLMVNAGKNQPIVVHCHAGCAVESILAALGLSTADLMGKPKCVAVYRYVDANGEKLYDVQRWSNPKTFRVPGGLPAPAERVLYQLPAINWARTAGATVYVVEGEKDADRLLAMGYPATTNVTGAGSWFGHYAESLVDCHVIVIADNDQVGRAHARHVVSTLVPYAASVTLTVPRHGKDVSDLLEAGYTLAELDPLSDTDDLAAHIAANVRTRKIEWAWPGYIPLGKLTMIEGDPGDGKSVLTLDLAARWSSGTPMPDGATHDGPWPVFMVSAEDDMEDTIVPRLIAAGANLERVTLFPHGSTPERPFEFASDLAALERRAVEVGVRVIIFDPLTAFLSSGTDTHNDMQVRHALYPLASLAVRTRAAVIAVRHLNKGGQGTKAIYRGNGSIAFTGAARAGFLVASDPERPGTRLFANVKTNLAHKPPSLRYEIESSPDDAPYIAWKGASDASAQDALDGPRRFGSQDDEAIATQRRIRQYEIEFLRDVLCDGPMTWKEIVEIGKQDGFTEISLRRARADIGLVKLVGPAGAIDVRWALRSEGVSDSAGEPTAFDRLIALSEAQTGGVTNADQTSKGSKSGEATLTDDERRAARDALPRTCSVCGSEVDVVGFDKPWFEFRCLDHDPHYYGG
jgi:putative DNA primase/helicase